MRIILFLISIWFYIISPVLLFALPIVAFSYFDLDFDNMNTNVLLAISVIFSFLIYLLKGFLSKAVRYCKAQENFMLVDGLKIVYLIFSRSFVIIGFCLILLFMTMFSNYEDYIILFKLFLSWTLICGVFTYALYELEDYKLKHMFQ
jgi:hypothetical protein